MMVYLVRQWVFNKGTSINNNLYKVTLCGLRRHLSSTSLVSKQGDYIPVASMKPEILPKYHLLRKYKIELRDYIHEDSIMSALQVENKAVLLSKLTNVLYSFYTDKNSGFVTYFADPQHKKALAENSLSVMIEFLAEENDLLNARKILQLFQDYNFEIQVWTYYTFIILLLKNQYYDESKRYLWEMIEVKPDFNEFAFLEMLQCCCESRNVENRENFQDFVDELFRYMERCSVTPINTRTLDVITKWFSNDPLKTWKVNTVLKSDFDGVCHCCGSLSLINMPPQDRLENLKTCLKHYVTSKAKEEGFTQLHSNFMKYLDERDKFDVVIDAINLTYMRKGEGKAFTGYHLQKAVQQFETEGKSILVICAGILRNYKEDIQDICHSCSIFFVNCDSDDYMLLHAILHNNFDIKVVSQDMFHDHVYALKQENNFLLQDFMTWQTLNHYTVLDARSNQYKFIPLRKGRSFRTDVGWHLHPNLNEMVCVSSEQTTTKKSRNAGVLFLEKLNKKKGPFL